jgi:hypothetical protein
VADIRVIQRRNYSGFALEALTEPLGRDFNRDVTSQAGIASPVNLAHSTVTDEFDDFVGPESLPD